MQKRNGITWEYLGDGVYAGFDGHGFWLYANDLEAPTDTIYIEPETYANLAAFIKTLLKETEKCLEKSPLQ